MVRERVIAKGDHYAHPAKGHEKGVGDDGEKARAASADHLAGLFPVRQKGGEALFGQRVVEQRLDDGGRRGHHIRADARAFQDLRSEEHTSELQSLMRIPYAVFCLQKNKRRTAHINYHKSTPLNAYLFYTYPVPSPITT